MSFLNRRREKTYLNSPLLHSMIIILLDSGYTSISREGSSEPTIRVALVLALAHAWSEPVVHENRVGESAGKAGWWTGSVGAGAFEGHFSVRFENSEGKG